MRGFYESRVYFPGKPPDLQPRTPDRPVWSVSPPFRELFSRIVWPSDVWHVLEHESHVYHFKETTTLAWTFSPLTTHHTYSRAAGLGGARNDSSTLSMLLDTQLAGRPNGRPARCGPKQNSPEGCERMSPLNFGAIYIYIYMWHTATEKLFGAIHGHRWFSVVLVVFCLVPVVSYTSDILRPLVWIWMPARSCTAP